MSKADQKQNETYSEAEAKAREEANLKRLLATPPKPHIATKGKRKESSQSEPE